MFKRNWLWALALLLLIGIGSFVLLKSKAPLKPIKVYKMIKPEPEPGPTKTSTSDTEITTPHSHEPNDNHRHGHSHEKVSPSHVVEPVSNDGEYDWRNDGVFDVSEQQEEAWKPTDPERELPDAAEDTYPPRDWHKTEDIELRAEYFYAQLLKQFGDIPEVHTVGEYNLNVAKGVPQTLRQMEDYLEANYHLFRNDKNKKALEEFYKLKALGATMGAK